MDGDDEQIGRIVAAMVDQDSSVAIDDLNPRLDCAKEWVRTFMEPDARTVVRSEPDLRALRELTETQRHAIDLLLPRLEDAWDLDALTTLLYAVPKIQLGLPPDSRQSGAELKTEQREFFSLLYRLLLGGETGPRLPTLLLSIGYRRTLELLSPPLPDA